MGSVAYDICVAPSPDASHRPPPRMTHLLAPVASSSQSRPRPAAHPTLRAGDELLPLDPGVHALGGRAPDAVPLAALQSQPRAATLSVSPEGATVLQRTTATVVVRIDGEPIGIAPLELKPGTRIEFGDCRLWFEAEGASAANAARTTSERPAAPTPATAGRVLPPNGSGSARPTFVARAPASPESERTTDAALVEVRSGARHPLPMRRISIGRDDSCDVIVRGNSVSRRHATIAPVAGGFLLRDESANGTMVNGIRIVGTYLLANGDVLRVQDEDLRVELDASA